MAINTFRPLIETITTIGQETYWVPEDSNMLGIEGVRVQYRRYRQGAHVEVSCEAVRLKYGLLLDWSTHPSCLSRETIMRHLTR